MDKISNCCGAAPGTEISEETGICSECGDHCEYVTPCKNEDCGNDAVKGQEYCTKCLIKESEV